MARALRHTWIPFLGKFSEVVQIGVSRTLFVKLFASLIRISGQLAFFQYPREMPNERITHAMSDICTLVCNPISDRLLGMTTRRWAYGAMGSMALLYMSPSENIVLEQNPADYFTFERPLNERRSAIPLLRILSLDLVRRGVTFEPHCLDCTVDEFDSDLGLLIPGFMPVAALRTLIPLFGDDNEEAESLRNTLVIHGISDILVKYLLIPGEIGDLAKTILDQLPAYLNGDAPHAVSYSIAEEPS
ncbi:hypothetical protein OBBRIDRAFT_722772 [Obba rivulosa]|uniref:Uncharacterized protein n=1 Tax=Obba rivulosa TaxID=1052685 RepID=A0A8E2DRA0_9APHY|nr:hypothetical protein OBBRIDRAFT_722772 [Obba rivulosa]